MLYSDQLQILICRAQAARETDGVIHTGYTRTTATSRERFRWTALSIKALVEALAGTGKPLVVANGTGVFGNTGEGVADEATKVDLSLSLASRAISENLVAGAEEEAVQIRMDLESDTHKADRLLSVVTLVEISCGSGDRGLSALCNWAHRE